MNYGLGGIRNKILFYMTNSEKMEVGRFTNNSDVWGHGHGSIKGDPKILDMAGGWNVVRANS